MVKEVSIRKMSGNLQMRIAQILSEIREMGPVKIPTDAEIKRRAEESRRLRTILHRKAEGEIFGVEIYNQKIADLQRQMFEIVWKIAEEK